MRTDTATNRPPPYSLATEEANGTWTLVWNDETDPALAKLEQNASTTITFYSKTRSDYQSGHAPSTPILANDTVTNEALANATTNVVCAGDTDCSTARPNTSTTNARSKNRSRPPRAPRSRPKARRSRRRSPTSGTECLGGHLHTSTPVYHPGDLICWLIEASFPSALSTHGSVVTDFLPGSVVFDEAFNSGTGRSGDRQRHAPDHEPSATPKPATTNSAAC